MNYNILTKKHSPEKLLYFYIVVYHFIVILLLQLDAAMMTHLIIGMDVANNVKK